MSLPSVSKSSTSGSPLLPKPKSLTGCEGIEETSVEGGSITGRDARESGASTGSCAAVASALALVDFFPLPVATVAFFWRFAAAFLAAAGGGGSAAGVVCAGESCFAFLDGLPVA